MRKETTDRLTKLRQTSLELVEALQTLMEEIEDLDSFEDVAELETVTDLHDLANTLESGFGDALDGELRPTNMALAKLDLAVSDQQKRGQDT